VENTFFDIFLFFVFAFVRNNSKTFHIGDRRLPKERRSFFFHEINFSFEKGQKTLASQLENLPEYLRFIASGERMHRTLCELLGPVYHRT